MQLIKKPWGSEEVVEINDKYMVKKLTMKSGHRCSLQYHDFKKETIYVLSGDLKITLGKDKNNLKSEVYVAGNFITIEPGMIHRMEGVTDSIYLEASTPEMEDVVRLSDDYNRAKNQ
tara:strand:- start:742 stop:1092 length:351 start_codon:yes stop_codon:yes gene_type:complete